VILLLLLFRSCRRFLLSVCFCLFTQEWNLLRLDPDLESLPPISLSTSLSNSERDGIKRYIPHTSDARSEVLPTSVPPLFSRFFLFLIFQCCIPTLRLRSFCNGCDHVLTPPSALSLVRKALNHPQSTLSDPALVNAPSSLHFLPPPIGTASSGDHFAAAVERL